MNKTYYYHRLKLLGFGLFCLSFLAFGILIPPNLSNWLCEFGRWSVLAVGIIGPIFCIWQFVDRSPVLTLDDTGITYRRLARTIPWTEVIDVFQYKFKHNTFIGIVVEDPAKYLKKRAPLLKLWFWSPWKPKFLEIHLSLLDAERNEIYDLVHKRAAIASQKTGANPDLHLPRRLIESD